MCKIALHVLYYLLLEVSPIIPTILVMSLISINSVYQFNISNYIVFVGGGMHSVECFLVQYVSVELNDRVYDDNDNTMALLLPGWERSENE